MIDSLGYKCEKLCDINPILRLTNKYPELPPEVATKEQLSCRHDWEGMFEDIKEMYEDGVGLCEIAETMGFLATDNMRRKIGEWVRRGLIQERKHPRRPYKWNAENNEVLIRRLTEGATATAVAIELGTNKETTIIHARNLGLHYEGKAQHGKWIKEEVADE